MAGVKLCPIGKVWTSLLPYTKYEDSCRLEYEVVSFGKELPMFRGLCSNSLYFMGPEDGGSKPLIKYFLTGMALCSRRYILSGNYYNLWRISMKEFQAVRHAFLYVILIKAQAFCHRPINVPFSILSIDRSVHTPNTVCHRLSSPVTVWEEIFLPLCLYKNSHSSLVHFTTQ
jgi:hypothetical protein